MKAISCYRLSPAKQTLFDVCGLARIAVAKNKKGGRGNSFRLCAIRLVRLVIKVLL